MRQLSMYDDQNTVFETHTAIEFHALNKNLAVDINRSAEFSEEISVQVTVDVAEEIEFVAPDDRDVSPEDQDALAETRVTEIIMSKNMANDVQLILPMLAHLNKDNRWLAWVDPPLRLLKQWKDKKELNTSDIMVLRSNEKRTAFELAMSALKAGTCHAVIVWTDQLSKEEFDYLDHASKIGKSHGIVLRYR